MSFLKDSQTQSLVAICAAETSTGKTTMTGDDFLGTVAVPLSEVTSGKQLDLPLLAATLAPWPRKHGAPSLQVTFDLVYADARGPSGGLA